VGRELHLSTATVKSHLETLYEKLGVSDRAAAVAEAMPQTARVAAQPQATAWAAQSAYSAAYGPPAPMSSSWLPCSTIRP
jgi:Bacterial regulatory proteins, luxR family